MLFPEDGRFVWVAEEGWCYLLWHYLLYYLLCFVWVAEEGWFVT